MKISFLLLVLVSALSCAVAAQQPKSEDHANLQGTWLAQTESLNGVQKPVPFIYVFAGDKITFTDETGKEVVYLFKLDTDGKLKFLNLQPEEAPNSTPVSVAYELNGDSLKIVVAPPGLRPTEISDRNNQELIICKRKGP